MSTRAHIIVTKGKEKCYTYHHCDGGPKWVGSDVLNWLKTKTFNTDTAENFCKGMEKNDDSYEFENCGLHGDEEYVYFVDLEKRTFKGYSMCQNKNGTRVSSIHEWWDYPEDKIQENKYLCMNDTF